MLIRVRAGTQEVQGIEKSPGYWSYSPRSFAEYMIENEPPTVVLALGGTLLISTSPQPENQFERAEIFLHMVRQYFKEMFGDSVLDSVEMTDITDKRTYDSSETGIVY